MVAIRKYKCKAAIVSLGCPKNQVDSEKILNWLVQAGFELVDAYAKPEVLLINTCAFIKPAEEEAIAAILEASELKRKRKIKLLVVIGCLVSRYGEKKIRKLIPEIDQVFLPNEYTNLLKKIKTKLVERKVRKISRVRVDVEQNNKRKYLLSNPGTAYLKIAEGCSRRCTFCLIPYLRGVYRSRPLAEIVAEAKYLLNQGVSELIVVAQDITNYGKDLASKVSLIKLIDELVKFSKLKWLRLMYANPEGVSPELIQRIAQEKKICKYLDVPIQHAVKRVLRKMGRRGDSKFLLALFKQLREAIPGITIRTTLLSGFPGETEQEHKYLMNFINEVKFDRLGVFTYSREAGTVAAKLPQQISWPVRKRRRRELMELQAEISYARLASKIGQKIYCIVEELSGKQQVVARTINDAPEIDGNIILRGEAKVGMIVKAKITGADEYDLTGEII